WWPRVVRSSTCVLVSASFDSLVPLSWSTASSFIGNRVDAVPEFPANAMSKHSVSVGTFKDIVIVIIIIIVVVIVIWSISWLHGRPWSIWSLTRGQSATSANPLVPLSVLVASDFIREIVYAFPEFPTIAVLKNSILLRTFETGW